MTLPNSGASTDAAPRRQIELLAAPGETLCQEPPAGVSPPLTRLSTAGVVIPLAGVVALALVAATGAVAIVVHTLLAGQARAVLGFRFPGVPATVGTAAIIFAANLRVLAGMFAVVAVAQMLAREHSPDRATPVLRWLLELAVASEVTINTLVVGGALGAYGARMVRAILPHGPLELAAWSVALALLIAGRRRPLPVRVMVAWAAVCVGVLAIAAILETWGSV